MGGFENLKIELSDYAQGLLRKQPSRLRQLQSALLAQQSWKEPALAADEDECLQGLHLERAQRRGRQRPNKQQHWPLQLQARQKREDRHTGSGAGQNEISHEPEDGCEGCHDSQERDNLQWTAP